MLSCIMPTCLVHNDFSSPTFYRAVFITHWCSLMSMYVCCMYNFIAPTNVWQTIPQILSKLQVQELAPAAVEVS